MKVFVKTEGLTKLYGDILAVDNCEFGSSGR
jgi:hypothetical protein